MNILLYLVLSVPLLGLLGVVVIISALLFRRVVNTNMVTIVQRRRATISYGTDQQAGNVYYHWPAWLPRIGVTVIELPVSNFELALKGYEAYDKDRVPFAVDVVAFFRIANTAEAAKRVPSINELKTQLSLITQGAIRKVLASDVINNIMLERAKFGQMFTEEVREQLAQWGCESVKAMELMDIRDSGGSKVIDNIMAMKASHIEMQSRTEVANNRRDAERAEIEAGQSVEVRKQEALQVVGERTAEKDKAIGIANEQSKQEVLTQAKETRERDMAVLRVAEVRKAEITKDQQVVAAEQDKQTRVIKAEGVLQEKQREATGIQAIGVAKAEAEKALQLAPVAAQITLAKEIGSNKEYQSYLISLKGFEAQVQIGTAQATALTKAEIKIIANAGTAPEGLNSAASLFSSAGGTSLAGMVEALAQSPVVKSVIDSIAKK